MQYYGGSSSGSGRNKTFRMVVGNTRECVELTQAACALLARDRDMSLEDAVKDVCQVYTYISEMTQLP